MQLVCRDVEIATAFALKSAIWQKNSNIEIDGFEFIHNVIDYLRIVA